VQGKGSIKMNTVALRARRKISKYSGNLSLFLREASQNLDSRKDNIISDVPPTATSSSRRMIVEPVKRLSEIPVIESIHFSSCFPVSNIVQELPPLPTLCSDEMVKHV